MWRICIACLLALALDRAAWARMYQWVDPGSGRTHMSGVPPAWYRSGEAGPRIFVFENGQIIDDTRITVSEETRQALREQAFKNAAPVITAPAAAAAPAPDATLPASPFADDTANRAAASNPPDAAAPAEESPKVSAEVLAKLKEALRRWDEAHSAGLSPPPAPPSP